MTLSEVRQDIVAQRILSDLQRRGKRIRQASGYFGYGAFFTILMLALIAVGFWQIDGWMVAGGVLMVSGFALQVELRGINRRIDALVEMQIKFEEEMKTAQQSSATADDKPSD